MRPVDELRDRLHAARRRAEIAGARADVLAQARAVVPEPPRDADAGHLERAARRLVRRAAQDEFAREGITRIPVPEATGRAELRRADLASDAAFHAVVEDVLSAVEIVPSPLESDDAVARARRPRLVRRLRTLARGRLRSRVLPAGPRLPRARDEERDLDAYLDRHERQIRDDMRGALVRLVRVPLERAAPVSAITGSRAASPPSPRAPRTEPGRVLGLPAGRGAARAVPAPPPARPSRSAPARRWTTRVPRPVVPPSAPCSAAPAAPSSATAEGTTAGTCGAGRRGAGMSEVPRTGPGSSGWAGEEAGEHRTAEQTVHDPRSD
ncbi:hypothetical protein [Brachybacterium sp. GPGPB12]|uniref:hypothetical protein n=1 Tax=Brachybacterium sp. GPGPB12 TaxID=3023517 RepID=UPI0031342715